MIERPDGMRQKVALESPSRIGLPTAGDHDILVALLLVAKQQEFNSDIVRFMPWQLLQIMGWPINQNSLRRLQSSLKRLKAVTATYENVWYSRQTKRVESCLITGILAEAKIVFRKGRRASGALPESYVQWTRHMHTSLEEGSVLDLDLDLYFSCRRPGTKHLLRHLNKVWHAGRKPKPYARDLKELACGHLGMTDCKDLKRNFQDLVAELESCGYLKPADPTVRYEKIRAGIWRVNLELHPDQLRTKRPAAEPVPKKEASTPSHLTTLPRNSYPCTIVSALERPTTFRVGMKSSRPKSFCRGRIPPRSPISSPPLPAPSSASFAARTSTSARPCRIFSVPSSSDASANTGATNTTGRRSMSPMRMLRSARRSTNGGCVGNNC